ncbi:hypothetical protein A2609_00445 [Candidatus Kaiserbacteria bacterium RIFOXYD1_FULL_47_14]|uniref:Uncharacterized protein n=1 Tax=Candidatus Kaiserbacteria bacterium RIFOXYD1_FULL_47_14 TaxID=1798533 RepID=A0A1F6G520_9BACT|nr:MAG: hypothetical protein A2609_00445 [Candidatus Kaiserbacteria bacterium RIFOXYD1_FULL_47_14]
MVHSADIDKDAIIPSQIVIKTVTVDVHIFTVGRSVKEEELEKLYGQWGLKHADPYLLAALNRTDATFADEHPIGTQWKDEKGKWHYFILGSSKSMHDELHRNGTWSSRCWFAGIPAAIPESFH